MRRIFNLGISVLLLVFVSGCDSENQTYSEPEDLIPDDPAMLLSVSNYNTLRNDLKLNVAFNSYKGRELYDLLTGNHTILGRLSPSSRSLIGIYDSGSDTQEFSFITRNDSTILKLDSLPNLISETLKYGEYSIDRVQIDETTAFTATRDSFFLLSSSQKLLEQMLGRKSASRLRFKNSVRLGKDAELLITRNNARIHLSDSISSFLSEQLALNFTIAADGVTGYGVATGSDSIPGMIDIFKGQLPQTNHIDKVHPSEAESSLTFTFSNPDSLFQRLKLFRGDSTIVRVPGMFEAITEISEIRFSEGNAVVMHSIDAVLTSEALMPSFLENTTFRDVEIFEFTKPEQFKLNFSPLVHYTEPNFGFRLDDFFVFTENMKTTETFITAFKSNNVLANSADYQNATRDMSTASSLMILHFNGHVRKGLSDVLFAETEVSETSEPLGKYRLSVLQMTHDRDFAHVNFVCKEATQSTKMAGGVAQLFSKKMNGNILGEPQFFSNHRTGGKDIVVQDMSNTIYLLSSNGKTLWKRALRDPVLGETHEVDILRNGKKQLAFATRNKLYVVDRNGKDVAPFPINFKDEITQPLSVFDYDNNRKYRFAIVQDKEVLLYDNNGKIVKGFGFDGAGSTIVLPVQHIRMGNKDYVLVAEESGKLNILSRVGKPRIQVNKRFKFSDIPIAEEGSQFVVITSEKTKESISQGGKVSTRNLDVSENYSFGIDYNTKATLDDNLLRINGKLVELPFGIYTQPGIFRINGNTYITVTETQEKKVYLFSNVGDAMDGFPVYGSSKASLDNLGRSRSIYLLVKGEDNEIILYEIQ